ncbi:DUF2924 domain-containing protein [Planctomycetales bacterium ZRK34]|nr:DUF2924 domain-containing protein [Planctomycetales bacterium ZRK34]
MTPKTLNIHQEISALRRMTPAQLRDKYAEVFGETVRTGNKPYLIKRIAWRLQCLIEGDISQRARRRAEELAQGADIRVSVPKTKPITESSSFRTTTHSVRMNDDERLPTPGTIITRPYKGRLIKVEVLTHGFECDGKVYRSLSAVAKAVTGSHCNGFAFFRLNNSEVSGGERS